MNRNEFGDWLLSQRGLQDNTVQSYISRAAAVENKMERDLQTCWSQSLLKEAYDFVEIDEDLSTRTRADYKTALNAYAEFCASQRGH